MRPPVGASPWRRNKQGTGTVILPMAALTARWPLRLGAPRTVRPKRCDACHTALVRCTQPCVSCEGRLAELAALEAEYAAMQASDAHTETAAAQRAKEAAKAEAVKNQVKLWDTALATRISLQRALIAADRLPGHSAKQLAQAEEADMEASYDAAGAACRGAITSLLDVVDVLIKRSDGCVATDEAAARVGAKRARSDGAAADNLWADIEAAGTRFAPFRDAAVDRWHRKTLVATGRAAMRSQMSALNQSVSEQVSALMRDSSRAIARVERSVATMPHVLCEADSNCSTDNASSVPGTYDDSAFYQVLLQQFLDTVETNGAVGLQARSFTFMPHCFLCGTANTRPASEPVQLCLLRLLCVTTKMGQFHQHGLLCALQQRCVCYNKDVCACLLSLAATSRLRRSGRRSNDARVRAARSDTL